MTQATDALHCEIITPERPLFSGEAASVVVPGPDGLIGVRPGHAPLLTELGVGVATVKPVAGSEGPTKQFAIREGFLQVVENKVTVLAVSAAGREETSSAGQLDDEASSVESNLRKPESDEAFEKLLRDRDWVAARRKMLNAPN